MSFCEFMEMALYEPGLGYYSAGLEQFGAGGDFVTAPEAGQLFARCLARQATQLGTALGGDWDILELGAGSGRLASDLLVALGEERAPARYRILDRSGALRQRQRERLANSPAWLLERVEWLDAPPGEPWQGLLLANEVIDALPVERFQVGDAGDEQLLVTAFDGKLAWSSRPAPEALMQRLAHIRVGLAAPWPSGYRSELLSTLPAWLKAVTDTLQRGVALFIDYGHPRREYYHPERMDGTLKCHYRQRVHHDPLTWPGLQDITASVDFTALAEAGDDAGLECLGYTSQAMFLLGAGLMEESADIESLPQRERLARAREIRLLTLPGEMGEAFHCMALGRGIDIALDGFARQDLRGRL
jgi:SAM-dependent MidA family methyltransferase